MTIMLIEDHQPTRAAMRALIEGQPGMHVVAEVESGEAGVAQARELRPDVVVMDIFLPGINGIEATRLLCAEQPGVKVLALSNHFGQSLVQTVLRAGGRGYLRKSSAFEELVPALQAVGAGNVYLDKGIADRQP